jgi:hypothetical protein
MFKRICLIAMEMAIARLLSPATTLSRGIKHWETNELQSYSGGFGLSFSRRSRCEGNALPPQNCARRR